MSRPLIDQRRHTLVVREPDVPLFVYGDMARLTQVVANVLNNAAKYQDEGGRIEVVVAASGSDVELRVRDYGIGIAPDMLTQVFELFSQGERMPDMAQGGLGIGLSLVKKLVEMHSGTVRLESAGLGLGAEFIQTMPALVVDTPKVPVNTVTQSDDVASTPKDILIVDDNRDAAESLGALLRLHGHTVRVVHDGAQGIQQSRVDPPGIVFLDIGLPGMDGYEVCRQLRAEGSDALRIFAITGYGQERDRERARDAGFDAHFVKPVDLSRILQVVAAAA
jgi:CheY-like chemotaxis protein